uniref:Uncharacterized protein n=1 Tax=Arundo donax TaxID=35708 RepID=A0A0A8XVU5_ARUDO
MFDCSHICLSLHTTNSHPLTALGEKLTETPQSQIVLDTTI